MLLVAARVMPASMSRRTGEVSGSSHDAAYLLVAELVGQVDGDVEVARGAGVIVDVSRALRASQKAS
jgi:hypothetical protein